MILFLLVDGEFDELSATPTPSTMNQHLDGGKTGEKTVNPVDFRGEAITFKATTQGVIQVLGHCIDLMNKREEQWKKKYERVSGFEKIKLKSGKRVIFYYHFLDLARLLRFCS